MDVIDVSDHIYEEVEETPTHAEVGFKNENKSCLGKAKLLIGISLFLIIPVVVITVIALTLGSTADISSSSSEVQKLEATTIATTPTVPITTTTTETTTATTTKSVLGNYFQNSSSYCETILKVLPDLPQTRARNSSGMNVTNPVTTRIIGGDAVGIERYPWQVALFYNGVFICGGSIITEEWIVTAAHCTFYRTYAPSWKIYAGVSDIGVTTSPNLQLREAVKVYNHPQYEDDSYFHYDVSLIKLKSPYTFTTHVRPICLPDSNSELPDKLQCFVSGWGSTEVGGAVVKNLRHVEVDIINQQTCNNRLHNRVEKYMMCAGKELGKQDACNGDSGGPLSCYVKGEATWKLAGVVSWGIKCGLPQTPGVYSRVNYFKEWIWKHVKEG